MGGVVVQKNWDHSSCRDSKAFSNHTRREHALRQILPAILDVTVSGIEAPDIDYIGVDLALEKLMLRVATDLSERNPDALIVIDGNTPFRIVGGPRCLHMPQADKYIPAVSAASMYAKVVRDKSMMDYAPAFPQYGFEKNKGYGTPDHHRALTTYGPCPLHRLSYKPMKNLVLSSRSCQPRQGAQGIHVWTNSLLL